MKGGPSIVNDVYSDRTDVMGESVAGLRSALWRDGNRAKIELNTPTTHHLGHQPSPDFGLRSNLNSLNHALTTRSSWESSCSGSADLLICPS